MEFGGEYKDYKKKGAEVNTRIKKDETMDEIKYKPIGAVHSLFKEPKGTPMKM